MNKSTQLKMVVCGVALVSLSTVRAASAQTPCPSNSGGGFVGTSVGGSGGGSSGCFIQFDPGPETKRFDYAGNHSVKVIVNVVKTFLLEIVSIDTTPPGPVSRYPDNILPNNEICIPYVYATSFVPGSCALYNVQAFDGVTHQPIPPENENQYFNGEIEYRIAWDHPTLDEFASPGKLYDNPRGLRADDEFSPFFDLTDGVFPDLLSGEDPGVNIGIDSFSQYIVVQQAHGNSLAGCLAPLNCSAPNNASANVFNAGQTVPIKLVLNPSNPAADLRLTYTGSDGIPHLAQASGKSNIGNQFRATGNRFEYNWSTKGLAPGIYELTFSPGTTSGGLFAPKTILVTLQ